MMGLLDKAVAMKSFRADGEDLVALKGIFNMKQERFSGMR